MYILVAVLREMGILNCTECKVSQLLALILRLVNGQAIMCALASMHKLLWKPDTLCLYVPGVCVEVFDEHTVIVYLASFESTYTYTHTHTHTHRSIEHREMMKMVRSG